MTSPDRFRAIALALPCTTEQAHFDRAAFRTKKRIFATMLTGNRSANLKLNLIDQDVFSKILPSAIYAVPNKWGLSGWTTFELDHVPEELIADALQEARKLAD